MNFIKCVVALGLTLALAACGGGGGSAGTPLGSSSSGADGATNSIALFTSAPASVTLSVNSSTQYDISGGTGPYTAVSDNSAVALSGVEGSKFSIGGISTGLANISVRDSLGALVTLSVSVKGVDSRALFTSALPSVTISQGIAAAQSFTIGGGVGPYSATSNNASVATASLDGSVLTVTGVTPGTAKIQVMDQAGSTVIIDITVPSAGKGALFTTAPSVTSLAIGTTFAQTYSIGGGTGTYSVSSSDASVATAVLGGGGNTMTVTGLRVGSASILVRDDFGTLVTIAFTVIQPSTVLQLLPATLSVSELNSNSIVLNIFGGTPPYRGFTTDLMRTGVTAVGSTLIIGLGTSGNRCVAATTTTVANTSPIVTVIDSFGASATSVMTIVDNGTCP
jgi:hypothetical protein